MVWESVGYEVLNVDLYDLITDRVSFVYDLYEVLNVDIKNFVKNAFTQKNLDYC